jgi:DNA-binding NarL/FixJ family response regulator
MTLIVAAGADHDILMRWSDMTHKAGYECVVLPPASLLGGPQIGAGICLFDLGPRAGIDPKRLFDAVEACPDTRFIAMSPRPEAQEGLRLLRAGVRGYCNRLASARVLAVLLATVASGEIWAGRQVTDYLLKAALAGTPGRSAAKKSIFLQMTAREAQVAEQVAAGYSNKLIAAEAGITERTVKAHLNSIFRKTGIRNRVQLALAVSQANEESPQLTNA